MRRLTDNQREYNKLLRNYKNQFKGFENLDGQAFSEVKERSAYKHFDFSQPKKAKPTKRDIAQLKEKIEKVKEFKKEVKERERVFEDVAKYEERLRKKKEIEDGLPDGLSTIRENIINKINDWIEYFEMCVDEAQPTHNGDAEYMFYECTKFLDKLNNLKSRVESAEDSVIVKIRREMKKSSASDYVRPDLEYWLENIEQISAYVQQVFFSLDS